jgi:RNA polymerase sigma-70 factor (ECF subfamily)
MIDATNKEAVERLVQACIKGDRSSQQTLYKAFYSKMMAVCMRYARNREEAQDILHEGYIKVFNKLKSFENKGSLEGWIRRIVVNVAIDHVRSRKEFFISQDNDYKIDNLTDSDSEASDVEAYKQVQVQTILRLLQDLSPAYKLVFNMYVIEDMPHKEIAERLNISIGTSKSNLAKAKMKLKEMVEKELRVYDKQ